MPSYVIGCRRICLASGLLFRTSTPPFGMPPASPLNLLSGQRPLSACFCRNHIFLLRRPPVRWSRRAASRPSWPGRMCLCRTSPHQTVKRTTFSTRVKSVLRRGGSRVLASLPHGLCRWNAHFHSILEGLYDLFSSRLLCL